MFNVIKYFRDRKRDQIENEIEKAIEDYELTDLGAALIAFTIDSPDLGFALMALAVNPEAAKNRCRRHCKQCKAANNHSTPFESDAPQGSENVG